MKEEDRLAAVVEEIDKDATIVPRGNFYALYTSMRYLITDRSPY